MESKFKYSAYLVAVLTIVSAMLLIWLLIATLKSEQTNLVIVIVYFFLGFLWVWMFLGELRTKAIHVKIQNDSIKIKRYLGFGITRIYHIEEITGYKTSILTSKNGSYEYLYLMAGDRKIGKLSAFYHNNYQELKSYIVALHIKNLGFEPFSSLQQLKDIFSG